MGRHPFEPVFSFLGFFCCLGCISRGEASKSDPAAAACWVDGPWLSPAPGWKEFLHLRLRRRRGGCLWILVACQQPWCLRGQGGGGVGVRRVEDQKLWGHSRTSPKVLPLRKIASQAAVLKSSVTGGRDFRVVEICSVRVPLKAEWTSHMATSWSVAKTVCVVMSALVGDYRARKQGSDYYFRPHIWSCTHILGEQTPHTAPQSAA